MYVYKLLRITPESILKSYYTGYGKYCIYYKFDETIKAILLTVGIFCFDNMDSINNYLDYCNIRLEDNFKLILKDTKKMIGVLAKCETTDKIRTINLESPSTDIYSLDKFYKNNQIPNRYSIHTHPGVVGVQTLIIKSSDNSELKRHHSIVELEFEEMSMNAFN